MILISVSSQCFLRGLGENCAPSRSETYTEALRKRWKKPEGVLL